MVAGCASTPDVKVTYLFPSASAKLTVLQTLTCTQEKPPTPIAVSSVTLETVYASDRERSGATLLLKRLEGPFADTDVTVKLTEDGRLASINATSTGTAGAALKSLAPLAPIIGALDADMSRKRSIDPTELCKVVEIFTREKQPPTLKYTAVLSSQDLAAGKSTSLATDPASKVLESRLKAVNFHSDYVATVTVKATVRAGTYNSRGNARCGEQVEEREGTVPLVLNDTSVASLSVTGPGSDLVTSGELWTGSMGLPLSTCYLLPIPKASFFGKQQFGVTLSPFGSITELKYATTRGASDALDGVAALAKVLYPSTAEQATAVKAEADLIAAQQRLARCRANPAACT
jgi:hypothetical protein